MSQYLLVHGYATGVTTPYFRRRIGRTLGFHAFRPLLTAARAHLFPWCIEEQASLWRILTPSWQLGLLARERQRLLDPGWQDALSAAMESTHADTIVAHSLGCRFVFETMKRCGVPANVTRIFFVLPETEIESEELHPDILRRLDAGTLILTQLWCPWDHHLLMDALFERRLPAGLLPPRDRRVRSWFFPLWKPWNLHTHPLRSVSFVEKLEKKEDRSRRAV